MIRKAGQATDIPVEVTVDWGEKVGGPTTPASFGINLWNGFDPAIAADATYRRNLAYVTPAPAGMVRFLSNQLADYTDSHRFGAINRKTGGWDKAKLRAFLLPLRDALPGRSKMLCISDWPRYMDVSPENRATSRLAPGQAARFAALCAELVRIANDELGVGFTHIELLNEMDLKRHYGKEGITEAASLYARCAVAVKEGGGRTASRVRVGGGAWANPFNTDDIRAWLPAALPHLDFFSYHHYGFGSTQPNTPESIQGVYDAPRRIAAHSTLLRSQLDGWGGRRLPLYLDEHNIYYLWSADDQTHQMRGATGAVFTALLLKETAMAGALAGTMIWNESDGAFGLMNREKPSGNGEKSFQIRPTGHLLHLYNAYLIGQPVRAEVRTPAGGTPGIESFAVRSVSGREQGACLLVNRSGGERVVRIAVSGRKDIFSSNRNLYRIDPTGQTTSLTTSIVAGDTALRLPADTIALVVFEQSGQTKPKPSPAGKG